MPQMKITGKIVKTPVVKEKVIFSAIKESEEQKPMQLVLFKQSRPISLANMLSNVKIDDEVTITGRLESNPRNNEIQIIVDDIEIEYEETPCPEYF
jgi:aspartyl/asparaginyl-tRNA synthetase